MTQEEKNSYRNPTYIYDEGSGGGGPDSRSSASSTSSRSSMKILGTKLKAKGRNRWLAITVVLVVVVVIIIAVGLAVYFTQNDSNGTALEHIQADGDIDGFANSSQSRDTTPRAETTKRPVNTTSKPTINPTAQWTERTTAIPTTLTHQKTSVKDKKEMTTEQPITTTPTSSNDTSTAANASVTLSNVLYNPTDVKTLTLFCRGRHGGNLSSLTIRRQFKDSFEPIAVASISEETGAITHVFYQNVTHSVRFMTYGVTLAVTFNPFTCDELGNFSCVLNTETETVSTQSNTSIFMSKPKISLPHSIVEDKQIKLQCTAEVWGFTANLIWKFRHRESSKFMDFSVAPVIEESDRNCSRFINSTLIFSPTMVENGSDFRCEINETWDNPQVEQQKTNDITLFVVPSNFCDGKRQFTIHPHPHGSCTLVVYCLSTGPLVYEIECDLGHCYDSIKTACVPQDGG